MDKILLLIAGPPGSGKTFIGKSIAKKTNSAYLDKDTVANLSTGLILNELGLDPNDRESSIYTDKIKSVEYDSLIDLALENLEVIDGVVCSAPFIGEIKQKGWLEGLEEKACRVGAKLVVVWVSACADTTKKRIISRGLDRDNWKLQNWEEYAKNTPHKSIDTEFDVMVIDNDGEPELHETEEKINQLIEQIYIS